jgi:hypothetical protein
MKSHIEEIVKKYSARIRDERVLFAPDIPAKKLNNALNDYARAAHGEHVLALIDNSFFGSAKDGVLLTTKHIYSNEWLSTTFSMELSAIEMEVAPIAMRICSSSISILKIAMSSFVSLRKSRAFFQ